MHKNTCIIHACMHACMHAKAINITFWWKNGAPLQGARNVPITVIKLRFVHPNSAGFCAPTKSKQLIYTCMHACIAIKYHATRNNWPKFFVSLHLHKAAHRLASPCIQSNLILGRDKVHLGAKNFDPECMYVKGRILIYTSGCVETLTS